MECYYTKNSGETWISHNVIIDHPNNDSQTLLLTAENVPFNREYKFDKKNQIKFVVANDDDLTPVDCREYVHDVKIDLNSPTKPGLPTYGEGFKKGIDYDGDYTIRWEKSEDTGSGISHYMVYEKVNSGTFNYIGSTGKWHNFIYLQDRITENKYYYRVRAVDNAGRVRGSDVCGPIEIIPIKIIDAKSSGVINRDNTILNYEIVDAINYQSLTGVRVKLYYDQEDLLVKEFMLDITLGQHIITWDGISDILDYEDYSAPHKYSLESLEFIYSIEYQFNHGSWKEKQNNPYFLNNTLRRRDFDLQLEVFRLEVIDPAGSSSASINFRGYYPYDDFVEYIIMANYVGDGPSCEYSIKLKTITEQNPSWCEYSISRTTDLWVRVYVVNSEGWNKNNQFYFPRSTVDRKDYVPNEPDWGDWRAPQPWDPEAGCPYVYTYDGNESYSENNILPQCEKEDYFGKDVTDRYMLGQDLPKVNNSYVLGVSEREYEITYLNSCKLLTAYHPNGTKVITDVYGNLYTSDEILSPNYVEKNGHEINQIYNEDGIGYKGKEGDQIYVNFDNITSSDDIMFYINSKSKSTVFSPSAPPIGDWGKFTRSLIIQSKTVEGDWENISVISPREEWSSQVIDFDEIIINETGSLDIRIIWTKEHELDYIGLAKVDEFNESNLIENQLKYTNHSYYGDVTTKLSNEDELNITINPTEGVKLFFQPNESFENCEKTFIFESTGWYRPLNWINTYNDVNLKANTTTDDIEISVKENYVGKSREYFTVAEILPDRNISQTNFWRYTKRDYRLVVKALDNITEGNIDVKIDGGYRTENVNIEIVNSTYGEIIIDKNIDEILCNTTGLYFNEWKNILYINKPNISSYYTTRDKGMIEENGINEGKWSFDDINITKGLYSELNYSFTDPGNHIVLVGGIYNDEIIYDGRSFLEVYVNHPPKPDLKVYREVNTTLTIAGRKDNRVKAEIYENGVLKDVLEVIRTPGKPNTDEITLQIFDNKNYTVELIYNATYKGANPTWLSFESSTDMFEIKETLKTKDGFDQLISYVLDDNLDKVLSEDWSYHFSAEGSYDLDGYIVSYEWDFGDGSKGNGQFVIHEYPSEGEYIISLTVTDDDGAESSVEYLLTVSKNEN
ncbi:MAG: PKD domain-containing protein [Thermoplasmata archaeon]